MLRFQHRQSLYPALALLIIVCTIFQCSSASNAASHLQHRTRRQSTSRVFVVPKMSAGDLFNVSSWPPNLQEVFSFVDPPPENLSISARGMVSVKTGTLLRVNNITFAVNVTNGNSSTRIIQVALYVVNRGVNDNIFANSPSPMWATCPVWIRPGSTVYQVQAIDTLYGAKVQYRLESGGEDKFDVDPDTGNVFIVGRWMFELKKTYALAISAQIIGMVRSSSTPSQLLQVYVGAMNPQFSLPVYNISFYENQSQSDVIYQVQAESFQDLALTYSMESIEVGNNEFFRLNPSTGEITLLQVLKYRKSTHQYNFKITVKEAFTNFVTTTTLTINLLFVNSPPVFLVSYYVINDVLENVRVGTQVLSVTAYDYDPGVCGVINFAVTDDHFSISKTSNTQAQISVAKPLDYDETEGHRYEFYVIATDGGNLSNSATVQVWMKNINDEPPQFEPDQQNVTVKEGAQPGLALMYIQAYDPDGDNITFTYMNPISRFSVDSKTGLLTLNEIIAPGLSTSIPSFNLTIRITDDGSCCPGQGQGTPHTTVGTVEVIIYRVNTQPVFTECRSYSASINENTPENSSVLTMMATDTDIGENGVVTFSSFSSENQDYFTVNTDPRNPKAAQLNSSMVFDRENPPKDALKFNDTIKIPVTVKVQDKGSPPLSTNCILLVVINDVNDNSPVFDFSDYRTVILNNVAQGSRVIRVSATDMDAGVNAQIVYSISTNCSSYFAIDRDSGWITRSGSAGFPTSPISCNVIATDQGSPSRSAVTLVTFQIISPSDSSSLLPSWQNYPGTNVMIDDFTGLFVLENVTNYPLVTLSATVPSGLSVSYFLLNDAQLSNAEPAFVIYPENNGSMPVLKAKAVDASQRWKYYLRGRAFPSSNTNGMASIARLLVNIKDINDKTPYFIGMDSNGFYPASISIHTLPGDWVVNVTAIDLDREWPNNQITYNFDTDCSDCSNPSDFRIDSISGAIYAASNSFKPNTDFTYTLGVVALDGVPGMNRNRGRTKVSIRFLGSNYTSPKFGRNFTGNVDEGAVYNTTVVNASVPETPFDIAPQYGITSGNDGRRFAVDFKTGRVYVVGNIDFLQSQAYTLGYRVFDGTKIDTAFISLIVSRSHFYPPVFNPVLYTSNGAYVENDPASVGSLIATVSATTRDNSRITYSLAPPSENFAVDPGTGAVTLRKPLTRDQPDGYATWQVNVKATDSASNSNGYAVVNLVLLDLNDHAPTFDTCCLWGNVPERSALGSPIMQLYSFDPDNGPNGTVTYSIPSDAPPSPFTISPNGVITLKSNVDYSAQNNYSITVQAVDGGGNGPVKKTVSIFVLDANDNPPIFPAPKQYFVTVPEEMPVGDMVLVVQATDADVGEGAQLTYGINSGQDSAFFYADSIFAASTGAIKINQRIDFDAAKKSSYSFTVNVKDPDPTHTDSASVTVTVYDINDNAPVFSISSVVVNVSESSAVGTSLARFTATDRDSGVNGQFTYFIDYRNSDPKFNFGINSGGEVTIRNKLDYEVTRSFEVHILAVDEGDPSLTGTATMTVFVLDVNDRPPTFEVVSSDSKPFVPAGTTSGTRILHLKATDGDNSTNPKINFSYDNKCAGCNDFTLPEDPNDRNSAWLVANRTGYKRSDLGFSSYNLSITVTDGTNSATYPLNVIVESKDENPPSDGVKTVTVYNYARSSGAFGVLPLGNVYVNDRDDWDLQYKTFKLVPPSESFFYLKDIGQLVMYGNAPPGEHKAVVDVVDSNFPQSRATGTVTVNVNFINDTAIQSAGSMRLSGIGATDLLTTDGSGTKLQKLQQEIAQILNTKPEFVDIFSFSNVPGTSNMVDVVYSAHGSPYYTPEKMNALIWNNRNKILQDIQLNVAMSPVDLCREEFQNCWDSGCATLMNIGSAPGLVNTNQTSFVGLDTSFVQKCSCPSETDLASPITPSCDTFSCYNSGTCVVNGTNVICICPVGFDGPRCQLTKVRFAGDKSYLYLKPLESCENDRLSLDFMTTSDGLMLYNGPMSASDSAIFVDFIAIQIKNGRLELRINLGDGEVVLPPTNTNSFPLVNDGKWHTVEVFHEGLIIRMVLDHCSKAPYQETLQNYTMDRSRCEVSTNAPREKFLLNVVTPLQLGGRSDTSFNEALSKTSLNGCIRNLQHNGELYDMSYTSIRVSQGVSPCAGDQCPSPCPANASCITGITGNSLCQCPPGFIGDQCATSAVVKGFSADGFANWTFSPTFNSTLNATSSLDASLQVMFRTRDSNGIILFGESFSSLERNILEVVDGFLQFRYDLGNGDWNLSLPNVRVNDGVWHTARVERHGNQVILRLDGGDDIYFNSTIPIDARRVLRISNLYGLGEIRVNPWSSAVTVKGNLAPSCLQDVRFMDAPLPLEGGNTIASVVTSKASDGCISTACGGVSCGLGKICYDLWNAYECRCEDNTTVSSSSNSACVLPTVCFAGLCWNGGTCLVINGIVNCVCPSQWQGTYCNTSGATNEPNKIEPSFNKAAAIAVPIIVGLILLLLLILLIAWCVGRNKKPRYLLDYSDDDASRENVVAYDEEGAGEEDVQAYDLMRLQKPVDPDLDGINRPFGLTGLKSAAPDPLSRRRLPGDYPNVGEFINDRLKDADEDNVNPDGTQGFDFEGANSQAGSLSSLGSSNSSDLDFDYLNDWGPKFKKLADLYGDDEDNEQDVSHV